MDRTGPRGGSRDRPDARPVAAQRRRLLSGEARFGTNTRSGSRRAGPSSDSRDTDHRRRHLSGPAAGRRLRRPRRDRLDGILKLNNRAPHDDGRRRRGHRGRVRVDVRGTRNEGHDRRPPRPAPGLPRRGDRGRRSSTCCAARTSRSASTRRWPRSSAATARVTDAPLASGKEIPLRQRALRDRAPGLPPKAWASRTWASKPDKRGRILVDDEVPDGRAHGLRGGRRLWPARAWRPPRWSRAASPRCTPSAPGRVHLFPELIPTGVYSIPEIGMVGRTEEQSTPGRRALRRRGVALGRAGPRRDDRDEDSWMLKLLVSTEDRRVLGVHAIGTGATELVHIGQAVMVAAAPRRRLPRRGRLQLPDVRRVLQGRGAGRGQPPALTRGGPVCPRAPRARARAAPRAAAASRPSRRRAARRRAGRCPPAAGGRSSARRRPRPRGRRSRRPRGRRARRRPRRLPPRAPRGPACPTPRRSPSAARRATAARA